ncbi:asparagine synthase (glutamine-hydrolyzing) [Methanobacterium sp. ACI-7]|uniref:asparagine synthase (glutamine-hydrolyzing) n=1 Tax=unclassified Methanobacterium TaxID=2627676 RepID=UPI0039C3FF06
MCGIAGLMGTEKSSNIYKMLLSLKHRGPDRSGIYIDNEAIYGNLDNLKVPEGKFGMGHNLLSIVGCKGFQPLINENFVLVCNGEIYNFRELKKSFGDDFKSDSDCEIILTLIKKFYQNSLYESVEKTVQYLDGDYAFAVYDGENYAVVRDIVGVKPLYFGEDEDENIFAFASERKALWNIGINNVKTLSPDSIIYNGELIKLKDNLQNRIKLESQYLNLSKDKLKEQLKNNIVKSVAKRVKGLDKIGILFSAGIDSTILAKITDDLGVETILYSVGNKNSQDLKFAKKTAEQMNIPLKIKTVDIEDVKYYLKPLLDAIEEFNIMKIGVGMPAYIAAEMAHEDGLKVMLSGQGADELFGGYNRYLKFYEEKGEIAQEDLKEDILNLYHVNLQRDDAVTMANSIELRVPYLDLDIINTAINIPMKYKINGKEDKLRKCILREVGAELGVPAEIVMRPKKAAQYGSGIHKMLKKVLKLDEYKNLSEKYNFNL